MLRLKPGEVRRLARATSKHAWWGLDSDTTVSAAKGAVPPLPRATRVSHGDPAGLAATASAPRL